MVDWGLQFFPEEIGFLMANVLSIGFGLALLATNPRGVACRLFATYMIVRGVADMALIFSAASLADTTGVAWLYFSSWLALVQTFLIGGFLLIYPRRRQHLADHRLVMGLIATVGLFVAGLFLVAPHAFIALEWGVGVDIHPGPLFFLVELSLVAESLAALVLLMDHPHMDTILERRVVWFLGTGFAVLGAHWAGEAVFEAVTRAFLDTWSWSLAALRVPLMVAQVMIFAATVVQLVRLRRAGTAAWTITGAMMAVGFAIPALRWLPWVVDGAAAEVAYWVAFSLLWLVLPLFGLVAFLRYRLFDIDIRVQFAIKQSTLAAFFLFIFYSFGEVIEAMLAGALRLPISEGATTAVSILMAVLLTYVLTPLQRVAERFSKSAMPAARLEELAQDARVQLYRDQLKVAWEDGVIRPKEQAILDQLATRLSLPNAALRRIHHDVTGA